MDALKSTSFTDPTTSKKYTLAIHNDECPYNPFTEWDCEPPLMYSTNHGRGWSSDTVYHYGTDSIVSELLDLITPRRLVLNKKKLLEDMDIQEYELERHHGYSKLEENLREEIQKYGDNLDLVETLASIARVPYSRHDSRGYSQGDYADVLIILTPEWFTRTGTNPKQTDDILKGTRDLFDAYIWGDVYGFTLTEHKPLYTQDGTLSDTTDDDVIDSCWGFYGDDGLQSIREHLPDFARPHLDALI